MGGGRFFPASRTTRVVTGVVAGVAVMIVLALLLLVSGRGHGLADGGDAARITAEITGEKKDVHEQIIAEKGMENEGATEATGTVAAEPVSNEATAEEATAPPEVSSENKGVKHHDHLDQHDQYGRANEQYDQHTQSAADMPAIQLLALGDSIALGIGDEQGGGYVDRLGSELEALHGRPVNVTNLAVNGIRSDELLDRLERAEYRQAVADATFITVSIGGNDLMRVVKKYFLELTLDKFKDGRVHFGEHLADILALLRTDNAEADIYILGLFNPLAAWFADMPELADIMAAWNRTIQEAVAEQERIFYVPIDDLFAEDSPAHTADDFFHPNESGYSRIAERALEVVVKQQPGEKGEGDAV